MFETEFEAELEVEFEWYQRHERRHQRQERGNERRKKPGKPKTILHKEKIEAEEASTLQPTILYLHEDKGEEKEKTKGK